MAAPVSGEGSCSPTWTTAGFEWAKLRAPGLAGSRPQPSRRAARTQNTQAELPMTRDDYQSLRTQYADIDDLCRRAKDAATGKAYEAEARQLIEALTVQQRVPEPIRSFLTHLEAPEDVINHLLEH